MAMSDTFCRIGDGPIRTRGGNGAEDFERLLEGSAANSSPKLKEPDVLP
jgi:hypothetical protein